MFAIDQRFERLAKQVEIACNTDDVELGAILRRYGTVLICGFVERSVEIIILERLRSRAHPKVIKFVKTYLTKGTNYNCNAICHLLDRFDSKWKDSFKDFMEKNEKEVESLSSVYSIRNSVAHGGDFGISAHVLRERCVDAKKVIDALILSTRH